MAINYNPIEYRESSSAYRGFELVDNALEQVTKRGENALKWLQDYQVLKYQELNEDLTNKQTLNYRNAISLAKTPEELADVLRQPVGSAIDIKALGNIVQEKEKFFEEQWKNRETLKKDWYVAKATAAASYAQAYSAKMAAEQTKLSMRKTEMEINDLATRTVQSNVLKGDSNPNAIGYLAQRTGDVNATRITAVSTAQAITGTQVADNGTTVLRDQQSNQLIGDSLRKLGIDPSSDKGKAIVKHIKDNPTEFGFLTTLDNSLARGSSTVNLNQFANAFSRIPEVKESLNNYKAGIKGQDSETLYTNLGILNPKKVTVTQDTYSEPWVKSRAESGSIKVGSKGVVSDTKKNVQLNQGVVDSNTKSEAIKEEPKYEVKTKSPEQKAQEISQNTAKSVAETMKQPKQVTTTTTTTVTTETKPTDSKPTESATSTDTNISPSGSTNTESDSKSVKQMEEEHKKNSIAYAKQGIEKEKELNDSEYSKIKEGVKSASEQFAGKPSYGTTYKDVYSSTSGTTITPGVKSIKVVNGKPVVSYTNENYINSDRNTKGNVNLVLKSAGEARTGKYNNSEVAQESSEVKLNYIVGDLESNLRNTAKYYGDVSGVGNIVAGNVVKSAKTYSEAKPMPQQLVDKGEEINKEISGVISNKSYEEAKEKEPVNITIGKSNPSKNIDHKNPEHTYWYGDSGYSRNNKVKQSLQYMGQNPNVDRATKFAYLHKGAVQDRGHALPLDAVIKDIGIRRAYGEPEANTKGEVIEAFGISEEDYEKASKVADNFLAITDEAYDTKRSLSSTTNYYTPKMQRMDELILMTANGQYDKGLNTNTQEADNIHLGLSLVMDNSGTVLSNAFSTIEFGTLTDIERLNTYALHGMANKDVLRQAMVNKAKEQGTP